MQDITDKKYDYSVGVNYMDIILELEKMADYIINVEEAVYEHKHDK
jgi:phosphate:Na+ symporter